MPRFNPRDYPPDAGEFELIKPGAYAACIIESTHADAMAGVLLRRGPKSLYMSAPICILSSPYTGRRIYDNIMLTASLWRLSQIVWAVNPEDPPEFDPQERTELHRALLYQPCMIEIVHREWQGEKRPAIRKYYAIDDKDVYAYAFEAMEQLLDEGRIGGGPMPEPTNTTDDEDLPF